MPFDEILSIKYSNLQKLVDICGYELPTNLQNCTQKDLNEMKMFLKVLEGLLFWNFRYVLACILTLLGALEVVRTAYCAL